MPSLSARWLTSLLLARGAWDASAAETDCLQDNLLFGTTSFKAEYAYICCNNQKWAETAGFLTQVGFFGSIDDSQRTFYDAQCGLPLFVAPKGRSFADFKQESTVHGWPSFRDGEVVIANVIEREDGEIVSTCGTHLGHNLPDFKGNRYCINLICMAGAAASNASATASNMALGASGAAAATSSSPTSPSTTPSALSSGSTTPMLGRPQQGPVSGGHCGTPGIGSLLVFVQVSFALWAMPG
eukprot:CAMPEP_0115069254 /NCGR_PEP_ID=MMETSP0227-20121206/12456_1 /TAXON_ID=89957 /ORGANISM="Polarella glacialis, Strain CCMP 1383" /LENGTH=240 /DNA_ID=CAMNT_0002455637 /DNA_START=126 /DNA_END=848 /DNA_ORIENTATION=-